MSIRYLNIEFSKFFFTTYIFGYFGIQRGNDLCRFKFTTVYPLPDDIPEVHGERKKNVADTNRRCAGETHDTRQYERPKY